MFKTNTVAMVGDLASQLLMSGNRRPLEVPLLETNTLCYEGLLFQLEFIVNDPNLDHSVRGKTAQSRLFYTAVCGNTHVFFADRIQGGNLSHFKDIPSDEWINTSNHDSCWRTDGMRWINDTYFEMCRGCNPDVAPATLYSEARLGWCGKLWTPVIMVVKRTPGSEYRTLSSIDNYSLVEKQL